MPLKPGDTLLKGQYRVLSLLGRGGFACVYHARDTLLGLDVAIKELIPSAVGDPEWVKRFLVEARATVGLRDDHIVATHTLFAESGNHYLVMEFMPGGSLEDLLRKSYRLAVDDALRIARQVCEGLAYAHGRGIVHCDLKPANILFAADGMAKVADFGIAHVSSHKAGSRHWATTGPFLAGTLQYMSPEQAQGDRSDPRTDLYALGALLYHALTGRPYADFRDNATPADIGHNLDLIRNHQPPPPSTHNPSIPPWLDDLVLRLLAKRPKDRPGTAAEVLALLSPPAPARQGQPTLPQPPAGPPPAPRRRRLPRWVRFESVALLVVILGIALAALIGGRDGGDPTPTPSATFTPTARPSRTPTLVPTSTPSPTLTPKPTATPEHTRTPTPAPTPEPTLTPTPTRTPLPPGSRFAFASGGIDNRQICVWTAGGAGAECLTEVGTFSESPAWSPDGKLIAFHKRDGDYDVYVIRADGTELTNLTEDTDKDNPPNDGSPSWSPDGTRIAFDTNRNGNSEIYVMNADGSEPVNLTNAPEWNDSLPAWSPDGSQIAFVRRLSFFNAEIYVMDADGSNQTRLTSDPEDDLAINESPAWSPDGKLIAFYSNRDAEKTTDIYVINADGSGEPKRLTFDPPDEPHNDGSPCWSPDGTRIAFDTDREGNWQIYVMNADGSDPFNLTEGSDMEEHFPAWWQE